MTGNPYYHEFEASNLDPQFIRWIVGAFIVAVVLTAINTAVKPISFRCRGVKPSGERARACRRICAVRLADKKDRMAIVLPSSSWDKELAVIWTGIAFWQGIECHGAGLNQWFCNRFYPFDGPLMFLAVTFGLIAAYLTMKFILFLTVKIKVALLVRWYELNRVDIPAVAEKWGLCDFIHRAAVQAKKRKTAKAAKSSATVSRRNVDF